MAARVTACVQLLEPKYTLDIDLYETWATCQGFLTETILQTGPLQHGRVNLMRIISFLHWYGEVITLSQVCAEVGTGKG